MKGHTPFLLLILEIFHRIAVCHLIAVDNHGYADDEQESYRDIDEL